MLLYLPPTSFMDSLWILLLSSSEPFAPRLLCNKVEQNGNLRNSKGSSPPKPLQKWCWKICDRHLWSYLEQSFTHVYIVEWSAQEKQTSKDEIPTLYFPYLYCPGWWCTHIITLTSRSFLPSVQFFPSHLQRMTFPPPSALPELMTYISCRPPQGQQRRTTPKGSVCVFIGALSLWSSFLHPPLVSWAWTFIMSCTPS